MGGKFSILGADYFGPHALDRGQQPGMEENDVTRGIAI